MLIGELIQKGETVYTPGISRGGSKAVFSVNVLAINAGTLTIEVQEKNFSDNTDASWTSVTGSGMTFTATGATAVTTSELKEQVRIKMAMSSGSSDWARAFVYEPSWEA